MRNAIIFTLLLTGGCSSEKVEEFAFMKTMEYQLNEDCGENDECLDAVKQQIKQCMIESDWRSYMDSNEDEEEMMRFIGEFFPCFKDLDGNSYFNQ
ncbi:MAG: hypothetical protein GKR92_04145 [Gammaproteobacteria bacterium]|nr:MAG: hypothetical protein GKR92_04145 [Gammaproteobacteria bacterium]